MTDTERMEAVVRLVGPVDRLPLLLDVSVVAHHLSVHADTIRNFIDRGLLRSVRLSTGTSRSRVRVPREALLDFLVQHVEIDHE